MKVKMQRWLSILLAITLIFSWFPASIGASEDQYSSTDVKDKVEQSLEKTKQYYENNPIDYNDDKGFHSEYWEFAALWGAGYKDLKNDFPWLDSNPWSDHTYWTIGKDDRVNMAKEEMGIIIGSLLLGNDPHEFGSRNMVEDLLDRQKDDGTFSDLFGESWALIALDLAEADYDKKDHIQSILEEQLETGAFGGTDSTGWMLTALAPYQNDGDVQAAIDKAIEWAHDKFLENEEFPGMGSVNSNSTSAIIMGLAAVGEDLYSDKWSKDDESLVEQLVEYQKNDGSFFWQKNSPGAVRMATEQALLALATVENGQSIFIDLKDYLADQSDEETTVTFRVEGINETLLEEKSFTIDEGNLSAFDVTEYVLEKADIPFESSGGLITKIGNDEQSTFETWDGWNYMINDDHPDVGAGDYPINDGDEIVWFYGNEVDLYEEWPEADEIEKLTLKSSVDISSDLVEGQPIEVVVTGRYDVYNASFELIEEDVQTKINEATVYYNGNKYQTDQDGIARIPAKDTVAGEFELKVSKDIENSYPRMLRQSKHIIVEEKPETEKSEKEIPLNKEIVVEKGQILVIDNSKTKIVLPNNLPEGTAVEISVPDEKKSPYKNGVLSGDIFDFHFSYPKGQENFNGNFQLTLGVDDYIDIQRAEVYYYNKSNNKWEVIDGEKDEKNHTITINVDQFSVYGVFINDPTNDENEDSVDNGGSNGDVDPEEEPESSEEKDDKDSDDHKNDIGNSKDEDEKDIITTTETDEEDEIKSKLPKTATNTFNFMLIGVFLLIAGSITLQVLRRRAMKMK